MLSEIRWPMESCDDDTYPVFDYNHENLNSGDLGIVPPDVCDDDVGSREEDEDTIKEDSEEEVTKYTVEETSEIYTDWANHYLERAKHKQLINDLQTDIGDGVLLADIIEAVTNEKVKDIKSRPKNAVQMVENINNCLLFLCTLGVSVDGINAKDIKDGNLKSILGLFFSLSRYKQQQKQGKPGSYTSQSSSTHKVQYSKSGYSRSAVPLGSQKDQSSPTRKGTSRPSRADGIPTYRDTSNASSPSRKSSSTQGSPCHRSASSQGSPSHRSSESQETPHHYGGSPSRKNNTAFQSQGILKGTTQKTQYQGPALSTPPLSKGHSSVSKSVIQKAGLQKPGSVVGQKLPRPQTPGPGSMNTVMSAATQIRPDSRNADTISRLPSPFGKQGRSGSAPLPGSRLTKSKYASSSGVSSGFSSASSQCSDKDARYHAGSGIPTPRSNASSRSTSPSSYSSLSTGLPQPKVSRSNSLTEKTVHRVIQSPGASSTSSNSSSKGAATTKPSSIAQNKNNSMLEKFRFFNKEKGHKAGPVTTENGQKSAASIAAVNGNDVNSKSSPAFTTEKHLSASTPTPSQEANASGRSSPKVAVKSLAKKTFGSKKEKKEGSISPKLSSKGLQGTAEARVNGDYRLEQEAKNSTASAAKNRAKGSLPREADEKEKDTVIKYQKSDHKDPPKVPKRDDSLVNGGGTQKSKKLETRSSSRSDLLTIESKSEKQKSDEANGSEASSRTKSVKSQNLAAAKSVSPTGKSVIKTKGQMEDVGIAKTPVFNGTDQSDDVTQMSVSDKGLLPGSTGIPKPTAAVKGTSKVMKDDRKAGIVAAKEYRAKYDALNNKRQPSQEKIESTIQDLKRVEHLVTKPTPLPAHASQPLPNSKGDMPSSPVHVAKVTPMTHTGTTTQCKNRRENSNLSTNSSRSDSNASTGSGHSNSNSSGDSVILRPSDIINDAYLHSATKKLTSDSRQVPQTNSKRSKQPLGIISKLETTFDSSDQVITQSVLSEKPKLETTFGEEADETVVNIKPMQPIIRASPYAYMRSLGTISGNKYPFSPLRYQDAQSNPRITASRHLLTSEPLKSCPSNIKRTVSSGTSILDADYSSDVEVVDVAEGYMSDGGVLGDNMRNEDLLSGYMSESGAAYYSRRFQARFQEGMAAVRECMQKGGDLSLDDDSFDDSSSISSGISDNLGELSTDDNLISETPSAISGQLGKTYKIGMQTVGSRKNATVDGNEKYRQTSNTKLHSSGDSGRMTGQGSMRKPEELKQQNAKSNKTQQSQAAKSGDTKQKKKLNKADTTKLKGSKDNLDDKIQSNTNSPKTGSKNTLEKKSPPGKTESNKFGFNRPTSSISNASTSSNRSTLSTGSNRSTPPSCRIPAVGVRRPSTEPPLSGVKTEDPRRCATSSPRVIPTFGGYGVQGLDSSSSLASSQYSSGYVSGSSTLDRKQRRIPSNLPSGADGRSTSPAHSDIEYGRGSLGRSRRAVSTNTSPGITNQKTTHNSNIIATDTVIITNPHASYGKDASPRRSPAAAAGLTMGTFIPGSSDLSRARSQSPNRYVYARTEASPKISVPSRNCMTEAESMESIASAASKSIHESIQHARSNSLTNARLLLHQKEQAGRGNNVNRSESLKSSRSERSYPTNFSTAEKDDTKSEKCYPSMLQRNSDYEWQSPVFVNTSAAGYYSAHASPAPSPAHHHNTRFIYPPSHYAGSQMSHSFTGTGIPGSGSSNNLNKTPNSGGYSPYTPGLLSRLSGSHDDEAHQVAAPTRNSYSFESPKFSVHPCEFADLQTNDLNALSDPAGFAHGSSLSLGSTSSSLYSTPEEKAAAEIKKLKVELENAHDKVSTLSCQLSTQGHVVSAFEQSLSNMTTRLQQLTMTAEIKDCELNKLRRTIEELKRNSNSSGGEDFSRRSTNPDCMSEGRMSRQRSVDSVHSISSACSNSSHQSESDSNKSKKKKNWLRSSFNKVVSRSRSKSKTRNGSSSDVEGDTHSISSNRSVPNSPLLSSDKTLKLSQSSSALFDPNDGEDVRDLKKQLRDKEMKLTDIRLEALSSAHQLEQLREQVHKMREEMKSLRSQNEELVKTSSRPSSMSGSQVSLGKRSSADSTDHPLSLSDVGSNHGGSLDMLLCDGGSTEQKEGRRITVSVCLFPQGNFAEWQKSGSKSESLIGAIFVSGKTKWDILDVAVRKLFKEYVLRVDPVANLGLTTDSIHCYNIGEVSRCRDTDMPELLPCGYLVGENMQIQITLKGTEQQCVDALACETLIPKSIVQRYISLLMEHRRIILCGPSGTGKSYLAQKLAEFLVLKSGRVLKQGVIATFSVDNKSSKELRQYLSSIADQCEEAENAGLPSVIILDNLHHVGSLGEVFNGFLNCKYQNCPYIIGTMNQATCSTTNLQLHHNFRWVLCANHMEPVKGFLGRYLQRRLVEVEISSNSVNEGMVKIAAWLPKVWIHLNKFLETHSSSDVTIGPRLFLSCPMDVAGSQVWFTDLWNYSIVPYLLEAVKEGLQLYGRRAPWEDPTEWVRKSYPWVNINNDPDWPSLLRLRPEDVGFDGTNQGVGTSKTAPGTMSDVEADPLLNMLMRLQEAASYSSPQSQDSDSVSLDSHSSGIHDSEHA